MRCLKHGRRNRGDTSLDVAAAFPVLVFLFAALAGFNGVAVCDASPPPPTTAQVAAATPTSAGSDAEVVDSGAVTEPAMPRDVARSKDGDNESAPYDVQADWELLESKLSSVTNGALNQLLPELTALVAGLDLNTDCFLSLLRVIGGLRKLNLESVRMLDSSSKLPAGILEGTVTDLGDYDTCLDLSFPSRFDARLEDFRGQYCGVAIRFPLPVKPDVIRHGAVIVNPAGFPDTSVVKYLARKSYTLYHTFIRLGLCLPSHCTEEDVQKLISPIKTYLHLNATVLNCQVRQDNHSMNKDQVAAIAIIGFFVVIILVATVVDIIYRLYENWRCHAYMKKPMVQSLVDMSLLRATEKLLTVKTPEDRHNKNLQAVHGIRTFNVFWIVVGHTYAFAEQTTYRSGNNILTMAGNVLFQPVINSFLCVDSFFFLSGFLLTFNQCKKPVKTTPVVDFLGKLLARYWRLVPVAAVCMTVLFLLPELASGPIWNEKVARAIGNCHRSWWSVLLNIHNFYSYEESCQPHYWYISADLQIFPVVLATSILMGRNVKLGVIISSSILVASVVVVGALTYINGYPPAILLLGKDVLYSKELLSEIYFRPYVHVGPYLMGSLVACLYLKRQRLRISPRLECAGWLACLAAGAYVNLVTVAWEDGRYPSPLWSSAYAALHRVMWAACLGWVVYACAVGRGGILNTILSWKPLVPVSRISFTIYVVHIYVIYLKLWTIRERLSPDHFHVFMSAISNFVVAVILGFVASVLFEKPIVWLWDNVTGSHKPPRLAPHVTKQPPQEAASPAANGIKKEPA
ncbi:nose resistant to fluoxetine protein 6-like [Amblyomma americanum]|uniref:Nose resistant-to-fluoxetine protein N-terminal domain-containing protein n=1 Tax=Amblyomma americanum TaxID=6943 RepID=A0AAQ4E9R6_AMBAM